MTYSVIEVDKIIYCPITKKYKIIFNTSNRKKEFSILLNNNYTKNIAMASENITSILLSQYELFINLLTQLDLKISKIMIEKKINSFNGIIEVYSRKEDLFFNLNAYIGDAIILAIKSFVSIKIEDRLLLDKKDKDVKIANTINAKHNSSENTIINQKSNNNKILMLQTALNDCLVKENYESAAFLRDRIKILNKEK